MTLSRVAVAAAVLGLAAGGSASAQTEEKLTSAELAALFPGEFEAIWKDKHQVSVTAGSDGKVRGSAGVMSDSGRWSIDGDRLCVSFYWWTGNEPRCTEVVREEGWYLGMPNGKGKPRVRFRRL